MSHKRWMIAAALVLAPLAGAQEEAKPAPAATAAAAEGRSPRRTGAQEDGRVPGEAPALRARGETSTSFRTVSSGDSSPTSARVAVERPNHLAADATGDTLNRASWYDGRTITVLDKDHNVYATIEAPATIDATLDEVTDEYGVVLPLADLLYSDPYFVLMAGVTYGRYLGIHQAAGVACHHLAFSQDTIEWQIWIDAGDKPLPRKLAISYVQEPGEPQYTAVIRRWNLESSVPERGSSRSKRRRVHRRARRRR